MAAEGDLSVIDRDQSSLFQVIVKELFLCSALLHCLFLLLVGLGKCVVDVVFQSIIISSFSQMRVGGSIELKNLGGGKNTMHCYRLYLTRMRIEAPKRRILTRLEFQDKKAAQMEGDPVKGPSQLHHFN